MADEIEKVEIEAKKRGRPKKQPPKEFVTEENTERLEMSQKQENVTVSQVNIDLHNLYRDMLGIKNSNYISSDHGGNLAINLNAYNPFLQNQRLKMLTSAPQEMDREKLIEALQAPQNYEISLRGQGSSLAASQYLYYKILRLAADIPMYKYYKIPELLPNASDYKKQDFIDEDVFVEDWLSKFDVVNTLKRTSLEVKREGKPTYLLRTKIVEEKGKKVTRFATWQKLMPNYVKLIGIGEHGYIAAFNMLIFMNPAISLSQYPDFIREIWNDLISKGAVIKNDLANKRKKNQQPYSVNVDVLNNYKYNYTSSLSNVQSELRGMVELSEERAYMFWVPLPQDLCYTFCSDSSNVWSLPDTTGLFLGLQELADYDALQGLLESTPLTALLTAEAETIPQTPGQDQTVLNPETIAGLQDKFNLSSSTNLEAFFAPLKNFKLLSLPNIPNASDVTTKATQNFITRAGLSGLISTTDKPSVAQVKASQKIEEAQCEFVTHQFESVLKMIINKLLGCSYKWDFKLWGGIFTFEDELKRDKELFIAGVSSVLPKIASAYGMNIRDFKSLSTYVNSFDIYDDFKTITQVQQEKSK